MRSGGVGWRVRVRAGGTTTGAGIAGEGGGAAGGGGAGSGRGGDAGGAPPGSGAIIARSASGASAGPGAFVAISPRWSTGRIGGVAAGVATGASGAHGTPASAIFPRATAHVSTAQRASIWSMPDSAFSRFASRADTVSRGCPSVARDRSWGTPERAATTTTATSAGW